jgi:hypothetical protein
MYIEGKDRYKNYTSRSDVYLFTLRDYVEMLLEKFKGTYIERSDMPIHSGYLLEFVDYDLAVEFISVAAESSETELDTTTYVLPHTDGNELPVYATTKANTNMVYIGLSEFQNVFGEPNIPVPTLTAEVGTFEMFGYKVSDLQTADTTVKGNQVIGTLKYIDEGDLADTWGAGNFVALKLNSDDWTQYTSVKVGLDPSQGSGLVEIISDPDKNGAFKVTSTSAQVFKIVATDGTHVNSAEFNLQGLNLLTKGSY